MMTAAPAGGLADLMTAMGRQASLQNDPGKGVGEALPLEVGVVLLLEEGVVELDLHDVEEALAQLRQVDAHVQQHVSVAGYSDCTRERSP